MLTQVGSGEASLLDPSCGASPGRYRTRWGVLLAEHGPGPFDGIAVARWLSRSCSGPAPVRQGFAAALVRHDASVEAAVSPRAEVALFYALAGGSLLLSSHPQGVIDALPQPPALDLAKLADLVTLYDAPDSTPYEGVRRLPLGHRLSWRPGKAAVLVRRWFEPDSTPQHSLSTDEAVRTMRETIAEAVAASLPSSGDVSATLSGGLDSAMVVGTAAELLFPSGRTVHTFTHRPLPNTLPGAGNWESDDGPYAERMCAEIKGLSWTPLVNLDRRNHLDALPALFRRTWLPTLNPANALWIVDAVDAAAFRSTGLLLTGATGNGPYSRDASQPLRELGRRRRLDLLAKHALAAHGTGLAWPVALRPSISATVPTWLKTMRRRKLSRSASIRLQADLMARLPVRPERLSEDARASARRLRAVATQTRQDWVDFVLRDHSMLTICQHLSPSVWWSDPLSDPEVTSLALRLPDEAWLAGGRSRGLAREASLGRVPDHIRLRTTRGSQAADRAQWLAGREGRVRAHLEVVEASPAAQQFLDLSALRRGVEALDPQSPDIHIWDLSIGRALGFGMFAAWYESEVLQPRGSATRPPARRAAPA
ncbi:MAG TPA: asparagine synthase-related protein [Propionibacteriaceae bacterium]|nr:asparagine synthase-related protein [Propionibacteriaceae bacterium]